MCCLRLDEDMLCTRLTKVLLMVCIVQPLSYVMKHGLVRQLLISIDASTSRVWCGALQPGRGTSDEATSAALYGADFLPLKQFDVITMIADTAGVPFATWSTGSMQASLLDRWAPGLLVNLKMTRLPSPGKRTPFCSRRAASAMISRSGVDQRRGLTVQMYVCIGGYGPSLSIVCL